MSADQKWGIFVVGCGVVILAVESLIRLARWICRRVDRNVERMVDDGLAALAQTDEWSDPWHATPTFRDLCANNPAAVDALAAAEASRADWSQVEGWSK